MDLSKLVSPDKPTKLELLSPVDQKPIGITIMVYSMECEAVRAVGRDHATTLLNSRQKPTADTIENEAIDKMLAAIESWDWGGHEWNGKPVGAYDKIKAREILTTPEAFWIVEQIGGAANDRANFTVKNVKT